MPNIRSLKFQFILLNVLILFVYLFVSFSLKMEVSRSVMFSTPDSLSYLDVTNWFITGVDNINITRRPFLYPLFLLFTYKTGGVYLLYFIQMILWVLTINFSFLTMKKLTNNYLFSWLTALILVSNLSLIALTFHGLTEIPTAFVLSAFILFIVNNKHRLKDVYFFQGALLFLVILTVLKPVFSLPLLGFLVFVFPIFYLKKYLITPKLFLSLLLILLPVLFQITLVKIKSGEMKVSTIGAHTLEMYFVTQGIERLDSLSNKDAYAKSKSLGKEGQKEFLMKNKYVYWGLFKNNVIDNIKSYPTFLNYPKICSKPSWSEFAEKWNRHSYTIHKLFSFILFPIVLLFYLIRKDYENLVLVFSLAALLIYYIVATGISFYQGDRLVLPSIAIWACLYPFIAYVFIDLVKKSVTRFRE